MSWFFWLTRGGMGVISGIVLWSTVGIVGIPVVMIALLLGTIAHEATHAVLAIALGELEGVGWQGGLAGGPYVDFRAPNWVASEVIRKTPLALGIGGAVVAIATASASASWLFLAGLVGGLLWTSPEDLRQSASVAAPESE